MNRQLASLWNEDAMIARIAQLQDGIASMTTANKEGAKANTDMILSFIKARRADVQKELTAPSPDWPEIVDMIAGVVNAPRMTVSGTFDAPLLQTAPANQFGTGGGTLKITGSKTADPAFQQYAAAARIATTGNREGYLTVALRAMDHATGKIWNVNFTIDPILLDEKTKSLPIDHFEIAATVVEGTNRSQYGVVGEMKFTEVSLKPGGRIAASFTMTAPGF
jgi:hypothetical protein